VAFVRTAVGTVDEGRLFVARPDGSELLEVTSVPQLKLRDYSFSPDGRDIVFTSGPEGSSQLWIAKADGSRVRQLEIGMAAHEPTYAPPSGAEIVFASQSSGTVGNGIYAVNVATGKVRTIVEPSSGVDRGWIRFSPDGSRIAYSASTPNSDGNSYLVHIVGADGKGDVVLPLPTGAVFQDTPEWSNDGTRLVVARGYAAHNEDMAVAIVPADGSGVGVETKHGLTGCCDTLLEWAPDDTSILIRPEDLDGTFTQQLIVNPATGESASALWSATTKPSWQRRAP
jgi:Tol biopolymer transport system component